MRPTQYKQPIKALTKRKGFLLNFNAFDANEKVMFFTTVLNVQTAQCLTNRDLNAFYFFVSTSTSGRKKINE